MDRRLFLGVLPLMALVFLGCGHEARYKILGNIEGLNTPHVELVVNGELIGQSTVRDGRFAFRGRTEKPEVALLTDGEGNPLAAVFLEEGTTRLQGNALHLAGLHASGGALNERYYGFMHAMTDLGYALRREPDREKRDAIGQRIDSLGLAFVEANRDNVAGLFAFTSEVMLPMNSWQIDTMIGRFAPNIQAEPLMEQARELLAHRTRTDIGRPFTEIAMPDRNGDTVLLSETVARNKCVLLFFWGAYNFSSAWSGVGLKPLYEKYHKKGFEVYAVTDDVVKGFWLRTMDEHRFPWINVGIFDEGGTPALSDYGIEDLPANFLISREGILIGKNLYGEALEAKVKEALE